MKFPTQTCGNNSANHSRVAQLDGLSQAGTGCVADARLHSTTSAAPHEAQPEDETPTSLLGGGLGEEKHVSSGRPTNDQGANTDDHGVPGVIGSYTESHAPESYKAEATSQSSGADADAGPEPSFVTDNGEAQPAAEGVGEAEAQKAEPSQCDEVSPALTELAPPTHDKAQFQASQESMAEQYQMPAQPLFYAPGTAAMVPGVELDYSQLERKPFLGGLRNKRSGAAYHHAATQTPRAPRYAGAEPRLERTTQTVAVLTRSAQTARETGTQMERPGVLVDCSRDVERVAGRWVGR
jgi:hypothetical protein